MYADSPGMIYYEFGESGEKRKAKSYEPVLEPNFAIPYAMAGVTLLIRYGMMAGGTAAEMLQSKIMAPFMILDEDLWDEIMRQMIDRTTGGGCGGIS